MSTFLWLPISALIRFWIPSAPMVPKRVMYAPPITGEGIVAINAPSLPTSERIISITAPALTTCLLATPVRPMRPMFSV
ncbi:hypothetical protein SDC9_163305 [bioreactor metagenome]|uniref:Uncharacterized protein n=1 Tax=bioreactor metagenome TaxID=1076179 RepID=A0A645FRD1_9ZZZZ